MNELAELLLSNETDYLRTLVAGTDGVSEEDETVMAANLTGTFPFFNEAILKEARSPRREEIERVESFYARHGVPFNIHLYRSIEDRSFDEAMATLSYARSASYNGMALRIRDLRPVPRPPGIELMLISGKDGMSMFNRAAAVGNGLPESVGGELVRIMSHIDPARTRKLTFMVALRDGEPVATSILMRGAVAGVYFVSTVPEHRGKGIGGWITHQTVDLAASEGYDVAVLGATPSGYPVYRRLGFTDVASIDEYVKM